MMMINTEVLFLDVILQVTTRDILYLELATVNVVCLCHLYSEEMAELLAVPLKKPSDVDVIKPLKNLILSVYRSTEDYNDAILEFSKLRNNAVWRVLEKYESSLNVVYRYALL